MPHDTNSAELQVLADPQIRAKVRRLIGKAGLHGQDRLDLEQEVWTRLWSRLRAYNPAKGRPHGFLATVIDRILINLLRERYAQKRDFRRVGSLHLILSLQEEDARQGRSARCHAERVDLTQDLAAVLARLPEDKRQLAEELQHHTLAEIARRRDVPRSTLQAQVRQLREIFDRAGLRDYL